MPEIFSSLGTEAFLPHAYCYLWQHPLIWLHAVSDTLVAIAYYSIPLTLFHFVRKRQDLPFNKIFLLFAAFIIACGTTHLLEVWTLWHPVYWLSGLLKAVTAIVSLYTAAVLVYLLPNAMRLPSAALLEATNQNLIQEIVSHRQTETALQKSEERYRSVVSALTEGVVLQDASGAIQACNTSAEKILGLSFDQMQGQITINPSWQLIHEDGSLLTDEQQISQVVLRTGKSYTGVITGIRKPDGSLTWISINAQPISRSNHALPHAVVLSFVDITDRKLAEKELELRSVIINNMAEGICLVRATDGIIVYANPKFEQMFGYASGELIGQHVAVTNYDRGMVNAGESARLIMDEIMMRGELSYEVHNIKKNGTPFWCQTMASTFNHPEYGVVLVAVQGDITERKQAEEQIKASLREKEVLLKEIHHRVKNNLQIIDGLLQMQSRRIQNPEIADVLLISRNRIASIALVHEKLYRSNSLASIDVAEYIPNLVTHLFDSYSVHPKPIALDIQVDPILLDIDMAIPCGLIITELVSNSIKHAFPNRQQGKIIIRFHLDNQQNCWLLIRDDGVGISAQSQPESRRSLGLLLVHDLVEQLKGTISTVNDRGTEFKIIFPKPSNIEVNSAQQLRSIQLNS